MKNTVLFILIYFLMLFVAHCQNQDPRTQTELTKQIEALALQREDVEIFQLLETALQKNIWTISDVLTQAMLDYLKENPHTRLLLHQLLKKYPAEHTLRMVSNEEKGEKLIIKAQLKGYSQAVVFFFHTDNQGLYGPEQPRGGFGANNPRLFGYVKTNSEGEMEVETIVPAAYPGGSLKHIHFEVIEGNRKVLLSEMILDEPPFPPTEQQRNWALENRFPVVKRKKLAHNASLIEVKLN